MEGVGGRHSLWTCSWDLKMTWWWLYVEGGGGVREEAFELRWYIWMTLQDLFENTGDWLLEVQASV